MTDRRAGLPAALLGLGLLWSAAAAAQTGMPDGRMSEDRMLDLIFGVPEIAAWADAVRANGNRVVIDTEQTADPDCPDLACLTCFRLMEDLPTHRSFFAVVCANPDTGDLLRWDDPGSAPRPLASPAGPALEDTVVLPAGPALQDTVVLPARDLLTRMPDRMTGWFHWDGAARPIVMAVTWTGRSVAPDGMVAFRGRADYVEPTGRRTRADVRMRVDGTVGAVVMWEESGADQPDFETDGRFVGTMDPGSLTIDGHWRHPTMDSRARFRLEPAGG
ncbi:hypothetical protein [Roseospira navarrensis]|uniref:Uncharacterized protein n=1 Tax=Roseospira navarrensis TaxID=140058 RepID=A0A7X1ZCG8_9PROT|nr:hypothetical protein [Roseospira navarrensis]MQX35999.1 hypothetical protein [Roseospira navarrensis]